MERILDDTAKRKLIRESAFSLMMRYGFQRTSMDDIAKACGMSRPALYLVYKNKEDICRAVVKELADTSIEAAKAVSISKLSLKSKLTQILEAGLLAPFEKVAQSPHGPELMSTTSTLAADIIAEWHQRNLSLLAETIGGKLASIHATLILNVIDGMKMRATSVKEMRVGINAILSLILTAKN